MDFRSECQALIDRYVSFYRQSDAAGCASVYAEGAELYSPFGPPAIGRQAIEEIHKEWVAEASEQKRITVINAGQSGDLGWCVAEFSEGSAIDGASLTVLARQPDGRWLMTHSSLTEARS